MQKRIVITIWNPKSGAVIDKLLDGLYASLADEKAC